MLLSSVSLVMVGLVSGFGFGSFPASPPPVLALGVVPVLVLNLEPAVMAPALAVVPPVLALFPPPALALGVAPFLMRSLALDLSLAGTPMNLALE